MIKKPLTNSGFSLVELIVVIVIFTTISSMVIFRQSKFSSDILITNLAYQMALEIRQTQTYGIGVRGIDNPLLINRFKYGYGIHLGVDSLNRSLVDSPPESSFILFADSYDSSNYPDGNDHVYGEAGVPAADDQGEHLETFKVPAGNKILDFCYGSGSNLHCHDDSSGGPTTLDITFLRPEPNAHITIDGSPDTEYAGPVDIILQSALGDKCKKIVILSTGQISVDPTNVSCVSPYGII
jgi:prepilin-type N-terminal cleavage/methylation domain-containing protein